MAKVELKQPIIQEIADHVKDAQAVVLVDARGLTVAQDTQLRRNLRADNVFYKIYKNTMMLRAFEGTDYEQLKDLLNGPSALAVSTEDPAAPARVLSKFAKTNDKLELKGGVVEGKFYDAAALAEIAKIPSRDELLSKLLGSIQSPIANFARVVKQIAEQTESNEGKPSEAAAAPEEVKAEDATEAAGDATGEVKAEAAEAPAEEKTEDAAVAPEDENASAEPAADSEG
ncbi:MAG: 50S ribosomal protein L10 [Lachnospiraceae bacterium]|nr:50S ribosomal protein L10 [Lachnospiraceae bacterium]